MPHALREKLEDLSAKMGTIFTLDLGRDEDILLRAVSLVSKSVMKVHILSPVSMYECTAAHRLHRPQAKESSQPLPRSRWVDFILCFAAA